MKNSYIIAILIMCVIGLVLAGCGIYGNNDPSGKKAKKLAKVTGVEPKERVDDWSAQESLSDHKPEKLTLASSEAVSIKVSFSEEEKRDEWDSYTGGGDVEFVPATLEKDAPDTVKKLFDDYNAWVSETADSEMKEAKERWELYHASNPDAFIALTPRVGMHLKRCDTSILSYITLVDRYNRDYEPDDEFYHGYTFDAQTGRRLYLSDLITDTDRLSELICEMLCVHNSDYPKETLSVYQKDAFKERIRESIDGCRDDGRFAWAVSPIGFEFYFTDPFYKSGYMLHDTEEVKVPFALCKDILYQDLSASYDFMEHFYRLYRKGFIGYDGKLSHEVEKVYYDYHYVRKDGKDYLYLSDDNETQVYLLGDGEPEYITTIFGEIYDPININYRQSLDPDGFSLTCEAIMIRDLYNLVADAKVGDDGVPVRLDYYYSLYGGNEPMSVIKPFEAEVFDDEEDTEPEVKMLEENAYLNIIRTDGETFIDLDIHDSDMDGCICRFYVTGNFDDGFIVNGHPAEEVLNLQGWLEE
ncbi:MAG: hypothetical protein K6G22_02035 [Lachnospiraceae bacterium]|nr:hypothetical protein [Lachnospiraceae bacterium]